MFPRHPIQSNSGLGFDLLSASTDGRLDLEQNNQSCVSTQNSNGHYTKYFGKKEKVGEKKLNTMPAIYSGVVVSTEWPESKINLTKNQPSAAAAAVRRVIKQGLTLVVFRKDISYSLVCS